MVIPVLATAAGALAALLHVYIFWLESFAWTRPAVWRRFGLRDQESADTVRPMAFNQGFYNLFLAIGAATGLVLWWIEGAHAAGLVLAIFALGCMLAAALVLISTGRRYLSAALIQGVLPAIAIVLLLIAG